MEAGKLIERLRKLRQLTLRDIEPISESIATAEQNRTFYISHTTLLYIEQGKSVPSIYRLFSLAIFLRVPYHHLLLAFGVDAKETLRHAIPAGDHPEIQLEALVDPRPSFGLKFSSQEDLRQTRLLTGEPEQWSMLPDALINRSEPERFVYALIGTEDDSMGDIIPPSSLVEIDKQQRQVEEFGWRTLRERPIYLIWHDRGYSCCWCQQDNSNHLLLLPHPTSKQGASRHKIGGSGATIIGRVVHGWIPFQTSTAT